MDEHQKRVILENMQWLCENTKIEYDIGTLFPGQQGRRNNNRLEKNYAFYSQVIEKPDESFQDLLHSLRDYHNNNSLVADFLEHKLGEKLSYKRRMVGPTFEKFLIPHSTLLYSKTVNPGQIVRELQARGSINMTEAHFIMDHPDIFYRNAEIYKCIRQKCSYEELTRILRDTGNSKLADHLDTIPV